MRKLLIIAFLFFPLLSWGAGQANQAFTGVATHIVSGNIVVVRSGDENVEVRLAGIDSPDIAQPYGKITIDTLSKLVLNKKVIVRDTGRDACNRVIGLMWIKGDNGLDISSRLVAMGVTWVYRQYTNSKELLSLEDTVRAKGLGLWSLPEDQRLPPWEWRKHAKFNGKLPMDACQNKPDITTQEG